MTAQHTVRGDVTEQCMAGAAGRRDRLLRRVSFFGNKLLSFYSFLN
jgi:hypothetical protein